MQRLKKDWKRQRQQRSWKEGERRQGSANSSQGSVSKVQEKSIANSNGLAAES